MLQPGFNGESTVKGRGRFGGGVRVLRAYNPGRCYLQRAIWGGFGCSGGYLHFAGTRDDIADAHRQTDGQHRNCDADNYGFDVHGDQFPHSQS